MSLPLVAIVGRPNVGKSSLLNALARRRISIVDPMAGVTRDRVSTICEYQSVWFEAVDTGGYGIEDSDNLTEEVETQIRYAIEAASLILFLVVVREEITPLDREVARLLNGRQDRVMLVANKADHESHEAAAGVLVRLGFGDARCISALNGHGIRELMDAVVSRLERHAPPPDPVMKLALVGRRNVGKSTFVNALAGEPRVIVSEIPGTTRDSVDVQFEKDGKTFVVIDTAGVRKPRRMTDGIDFYAFKRAQRAMRRADVVLFLIDATQPVSEVDKRLAGYLTEQFKPVVLVINKWDLAKDRASSDDYGSYLTKTLPPLHFAPIAFTTATAVKNVYSAVDTASMLFKQARTRVGTGRLNDALKDVLADRAPSGGKAKIYYATQIGAAPPTIVLFCNNSAMIKENYRRYAQKHLSERLPFA
ncbi:MAG: ribosome biogenesis GTPase Der, partial [Phycisphaerae bacterium]